MLATPSAAASGPPTRQSSSVPASGEREPEHERRARRELRGGQRAVPRAHHQRVAVALDVHVERVRGGGGQHDAEQDASAARAGGGPPVASSSTGSAVTITIGRMRGLVSAR